MKVLVDLCVVPVGTGLSLSEYVAECERILRGAGLEVQLHANGTNVAGEWDAVFGAIRRCHERLHELGVVRLYTSLSVNTRTDRDQTMQEKIDSVERRLTEGG
jgi:uncharacterized protein (TIGR00106 family)